MWMKHRNNKWCIEEGRKGQFTLSHNPFKPRQPSAERYRPHWTREVKWVPNFTVDSPTQYKANFQGPRCLPERLLQTQAPSSPQHLPTGSSSPSKWLPWPQAASRAPGYQQAPVTPSLLYVMELNVTDHQGNAKQNHNEQSLTHVMISIFKKNTNVCSREMLPKWVWYCNLN